ncbi:hypothetical protein SCHPADRAFT_712239 [Schizopora paradoxa]|uniref:KOW domain-containing protein n=1 Tax=Schizopora paradoxa TaxID=27342 RepID=A0A0H2RLR8_9AGAM|nr:hypothetical protein SCHPADRAFT_721127 [Schizopora paradoxa]KLO05791.1 hypothetical protein SCHPADRAFT_712239 [Schizopora paradoxa]
MRKRLDEEEKGTNRPLRLFKSVFAVPTAPGRVYIESDSFASVSNICSFGEHSLHFVYLQSAFRVSTVEAVALLQSKPRVKHVEVGSKVIMKCGLYKDDVGLVVSSFVDKDWLERLDVKLKSRESNPRNRKRKRTNKTRCEPHVVDRAILEADDRDLVKSIRGREDIFLYNNKRYTADGYRLLEVVSDQVNLFRPALEEHRLPDHHPVFVSLKTSIKNGDRVEITKGPFERQTGYVIEKNDSSALIQLLPHETDKSRNDPRNRDELQLEISLDLLRRSFAIGDHIQVIAGLLLGRTGYIASINRGDLVTNTSEGPTTDTLTVSDVDVLEEFEVPAPYATSFTPAARTTDNPGSGKLVCGSPVIITSGKHEGKTGTISDGMGSMVLVIEDMTLIKLKLPREAVKYRVGTPVVIIGGIHEGTFGLVVREDNFIVHFVENETSKELRAPRELVIFDPSHQFEMDPVDDYHGIESDGVRLCFIDHRTQGFEEQLVYVWYGSYKGRLGTVKQISGSVAQVNFTSAFHGRSVQFVQADYLLARCACTLAPGKKPTLSISEFSKVKVLFDNPQATSSNTPIPRSRTPENSTGVTIHAGPGVEFHGNQYFIELIWFEQLEFRST